MAGDRSRRRCRIAGGAEPPAESAAVALAGLDRQGELRRLRYPRAVRRLAAPALLARPGPYHFPDPGRPDAPVGRSQLVRVRIAAAVAKAALADANGSLTTAA